MAKKTKKTVKKRAIHKPAAPIHLLNIVLALAVLLVIAILLKEYFKG